MTILVGKIMAAMAALALLISGVAALTVQDLTLGSAGEVPAALSVATTTAVGPQEVIEIFGASANCSSRIISTTDGTGAAIQVLFGDGVTGDLQNSDVDEVTGHLQAASTTVVYDAGLYGCGTWGVYGAASSTLLLTEFN